MGTDEHGFRERGGTLPLWNWATCRRVQKRGLARALQKLIRFCVNLCFIGG